MAAPLKGTFPLFRIAGVDVRLHWLWILIAVFQVSDKDPRYSSMAWNVAEYLSLFLIVLLHEFGHVMACRSVGGKADRILLWPLGGVAYVEPPPRPGANLWTIAAGPLVNLVLAPALIGLFLLAGASGWRTSNPDLYEFTLALMVINAILFIFNMLPIYPLDGGQILRSLLWFAIGKTNSLAAAALVGFVGAGGILLLAVWLSSFWTGIMAGFVFLACIGGWKHARAAMRSARAPRRKGFACPGCSAVPAVGAFWFCRKCGRDRDPFRSREGCIQCADYDPEIRCLECDAGAEASTWEVTPDLGS